MPIEYILQQLNIKIQIMLAKGKNEIMVMSMDSNPSLLSHGINDSTNYASCRDSPSYLASAEIVRDLLLPVEIVVLGK